MKLPTGLCFEPGTRRKSWAHRLPEEILPAVLDFHCEAFKKKGCFTWLSPLPELPTSSALAASVAGSSTVVGAPGGSNHLWCCFQKIRVFLSENVHMTGLSSAVGALNSFRKQLWHVFFRTCHNWYRAPGRKPVPIGGLSSSMRHYSPKKEKPAFQCSTT